MDTHGTHSVNPSSHEVAASSSLRSERTHGSAPIRRRSSTLRRVARNAETFNRNRDHRVRLRRSDDGIPTLSPHRTRARAPARIGAEEQEDEEVQQQGRQSANDTSGLGAIDGLRINSRQDSQPSNQFGEWRPSIVLGSSLSIGGEDLDSIQLADRKVAQTRLWVSHYQGVPEFVRMHQEAVQEREQLNGTAEVNTIPRLALSLSHSISFVRFGNSPAPGHTFTQSKPAPSKRVLGISAISSRTAASPPSTRISRRPSPGTSPARSRTRIATL